MTKVIPINGVATLRENLGKVAECKETFWNNIYDIIELPYMEYLDRVEDLTLLKRMLNDLDKRADELQQLIEMSERG